MGTVKTFPISDKSIVKVRALYLGERIDIKTHETKRLLASMPLTFNTGNSGVAVFFNYVVVVLFDVDPIEKINFIDKLNYLVIK